MYPSVLLLSALSLLGSNVCQAQLSSPKRGLAYTDNVPAGGNGVWDAKNSDLTWYYNYDATPTEDFDNSKLQFVPMLWGLNSASNFYTTVTGLISSGTKVEQVFGFNEPDLCAAASAGGSCIAADKAAQIWMQQIEPLKNHGIRLGAPAVTNAGLSWLHAFFKACSQCTIDFIPLHYYGDFTGLVTYIDLVRGSFPRTQLWVTEFGMPNATVFEAQRFYNESVHHLDPLKIITRYSYFGAFRSNDADPWLGSNGAMMNDIGELTNIGSWYLGQPQSGRAP